ncbi:hypothetical protein [Aeromicrobium sp. HA]|uniref:hypothetical protein n=1 Tax=Aeromicrobium sp. HA TaxID=3009077 RepID=UPI0022AFB41D|nr:hypothetical protein [Aeromicrobium sp. HA]
MLILERDVQGLARGTFGQRLVELDGGPELIEAANERATTLGATELSAEFIDGLSVYVLPWNVAAEETRDLLAQRFRVPPVVAAHLGLVLRDLISECQDHNAQSSAVGRRGTTAAAMTGTLLEALSGLSFEHLSDAFREGVCDTLDLDTPLAESRFFEGVEAQPGHVAAGLPTPRPLETEAVLTAAHEGSAVVITGPSGVGKSTVLWAAAYSSRNIHWVRINRLNSSDVAKIMRFVKSSAPTERSPIGLVVDGIGRAGIDAWDELRGQVARVPNVLLVGTCRTEDLVAITSLAECSLVEVELDEGTALRIHQQLAALGRTEAPHWREPFELAHGLTLEYTYLLTQGARLREVIADQVRRRVEERRDTELDVLRLASTAHRWRAHVDVQGLQQHLELKPSDLAHVLRRLRNEHLLYEVDGILTGRHQLRSTALSVATHEFPPPLMAHTVAQLVSWLEVPQIRSFVIAALIESPALDEVVLAALRERNVMENDIHLLTETLEALRLVDFKRTSSEWNEKLEAENVAVAFRAITVQLAMAGNTDVDFLRPEIVSALPKLDGAVGAAGPLRSSFLEALDNGWAARVLTSSGSLNEVADLLNALKDTEDAVTGELMLSGTPLERSLRTCSADELADTLSAARTVTPDLAVGLRNHADNGVSIRERIFHSNPWITEVDVINEDVLSVARCRMVVVSEETITDYHEDAVNIARLVLGCFPEADRADVKLLWPDGQPASFGDHELGSSELLRRYAISTGEVRWNRIRASVASSAWRTGGTERVRTADEVLSQVEVYLNLLARRYVLGRFRAKELATANEVAESLTERANSLSTFVSSDLPIFESDVDTVASEDPLHTLAAGITGNLTAGLGRDERTPAQLAAFIHDTLLPAVTQSNSHERWDLVDADPSERIEVITSVLKDLLIILRAVNFGAVSLPVIRDAASSGPYEGALARAVSRAEGRLQSAETEFDQSLREVVAALNLDATVFVHSDQEVGALTWPGARVCIGIPCESVLDIDTNLSEVGAALASLDWRNGIPPPVLLVPTFEGRPCKAFVHQWTGRMLPAEEQFDRWVDSFSAHVVPALHVAVKDCLEALRSLSAAVVVSRTRDDSGGVQEFADNQMIVLKKCLSSIHALGRDAVIEDVISVIEEFAGRVENEASPSADPNVALSDTLAGAVAEGIRGVASDTWTTYNLCHMISAQWDIEPTAAIRLLTGSDGESGLSNDFDDPC